MLRLKAHDDNAVVYFGLYYNPYGETPAEYTHSFPRKSL